MQKNNNLILTFLFENEAVTYVGVIKNLIQT